MLVNRRQRRAAARLKRTSKGQPAKEPTACAAPTGMADLLATGRKLHQVGRLAEAEACYRQVLAVQPNHADALNLLGLAAYQMGHTDVAIEAIGRAIETNGQNPGYFSNLGNVFYGCGRFDKAVAAYRQAISIYPRFADAYSNLGAALEKQGKLDEAVAAYRQAICLKPDFADAHGNLGIVLKEQGKLNEAVTAYRQAISIRPNDAKAHYNLGVALKEQGKLDEVVTANRQAIRIKPDFADAYFNLGLALKEQGKLDESRNALEKAVELSPARAGNYRVLADAKQFRSGDPHLAAMEKLAREMASLSREEQIDLHFALAKAYEDLEEHERCFKHLLEGNALQRRRISYDEASTLHRFSRIRETFTLKLMREMQGFGDPSTVPVFIVGMPRSGTSLIEQILASHRKVFGAGELDNIPSAVAKLIGRDDASMRFPEVVSSMRAEQLRQLGSNYITAVGALAPRAERITDKMPLNFAYVGLIHLALPNARIIHARRDPLDTCFSCFSKLFAGDQPYSYDLGELGRFYRSYEALMEHWRSVLTPGVMLEVQYEDVTGDLEIESRRILAHCGLEWDDACLSFHKTERSVRTASAVQVRQPIYLSSIGRWRHYGRQLGPLIDALGRDLADGPSTPALKQNLAAHYDLANTLQGNLDAAQADYQRASALSQNPADAHNRLGNLLEKQDKLDDAVCEYRRALRLRPNFTEAHIALGDVRFRQGKLDEAVAAYERALAIEPNYSGAHNKLGVALVRQGRLSEALAQLRRALVLEPNFAEAHVNLGIVLQKQGEFQDAACEYQHALALRPDFAEAHHALGHVWQQQGKLVDAIAEYRRALALNADFADAYISLGNALRDLGRLDEARLAYENAIQLSPKPGFYFSLASSKRFFLGDAHLAALEKMASASRSLGDEDRIYLHFTLGKAYDDLGDHERAFHHLHEGNALKRRRIAYDDAAMQDLFRHIKSIFTPELIRDMRYFGEPSHLPVFIIGMPRSGGTLIEQILASHPKVFGAGELANIVNAVAKLNGQDDSSMFVPDVVSTMTGEQLHRFGASYVGAVSALAPKANRITDKMPLNFLYAGLIHLAMPNARIIHTRRDALDTCFSCFSKLFVGDHPYSYNLAELAHFYRAYEGLMEHWRGVLPPGVMLEVQYEQVTADFEGEARRIVNHCGLDWDDACLSFHETERPVRTASAVQVRQPIYRSSIGRWRPYARQLGPLIAALEADSASDAPLSIEVSN